MTSGTIEPQDHHTYHQVSFLPDSFEFFMHAVAFYKVLLDDDIKAIEDDGDLALLVPENERRNLEVYRERVRAERVLSWMTDRMAAPGVETWGVETDISHGTVRFLRSAGLLYLKKLRLSRESLVARPNVSRYALETIDQKLSRYDELTGLGVFGRATPRQLLVDEVTHEHVAHPAPTPQSASFGGMPRACAVLIDTIEILDPQLRDRCLDLFEKFHTEGQHDRLDTVIGEAQRILEDRLRRRCGAKDEVCGVDLATYALGSKPPRLVASAVAAEQEAAHLLFRGVFGFIRNHVLHHLVDNLSPQRTLQIVGLVDYLLSVVDATVRTDETVEAQ